MEERIAPVEVPVLNDLVNKCSDENAGNSSNQLDFQDVSMPVCFLVKEQAKSLVAIQDLQKRVENLEAIQDDVIDSLAEIRKFLCNDSKTYSDLNTESSLNASSQSPFLQPIAKSGSFSKSNRFGYSPVILKETKYLSSKEGTSKSLSPLQISNHCDKNLDSKNKESALESDKQDSGLDSDCREVHDHFSLNNPPVKWIKSESNDELLQLLDEISHRTEVLQNHVAVSSQKSCLDDSQLGFPVLSGDKQPSAQREGTEKTPSSSAAEYMEETAGKRHSDNEFSQHLESKSLSDRVPRIQKRAANKIDSSMVSSILKETNIVDLQRQVLIYLVENAVLQTKLGELEHSLSSKTIESNKLENSLKDEARLLMMENRELRISLDEQKLETNALRSKVLMLERVLQSVSVENRELTWQLGESLGVQNFSRKEPHKYSSSYTYGNPAASKFSRRCSLPTQFSNHNETNVNCMKSKLLSNASSFLDVTIEETEPHWSKVQTPGVAFEKRVGPVQSSTPMATLMKLKDVKSGVGSPIAGVSNFQSVKKRFKATESDVSVYKSRSSENHPDEAPPTEACAKSVKFNPSSFDDEAGKFPFNTIIEKLKANSDYRISKRTSQTNEVAFSGEHSKSVSSVGKGKLPVSEGEESNLCNDNLRQTNQSKNFQARKGKNIHQRIQDILDRIMSESEEAT